MPRRFHIIAITLISIIMIIAMCLTLLSPAVRAVFFSSGISEETQGMLIARDMGCFHCHGDMGAGGVPNPGGADIPAWQGFTFMMSMQNEAELREWILDGAPKRLLESKSFREKRAARTIQMPGYRGRLTNRELDALVIFYQGVSGIVWPKNEDAEKGYEVAEAKGCFACHGPAGRIALRNPGSLTGRIPAWNGPNYDHLVQNETELREWIMKGQPQRLANHTIAQWFLKRQKVHMPAYEGQITEEEYQAIAAYIRWLRTPSAPGHTPSYEY